MPHFSLTNSALLTFWFSSLALLYTFIGYSTLIHLRSRHRPPHRPTPSTQTPSACVVLVAHNEAQRIPTRLTNLLDSLYPPHLLRVLVVSDASTDLTASLAASHLPSRVSSLSLPTRSGKAAGINAALATIHDEFVVFTDARQRFAPNAIPTLLAHFTDPSIGAVSGSLEIDPALSSIGSSVDTYWRLEKALRSAESRLDSSIGCTGAIYAIRSSLFTPIPTDTILDDLLIPMQIAASGARILHDPTAIAFDPQPLEPANEQRRKQRTLAGNFQLLFRYPLWLLPSGHRLWWQLISHKYLRLAAPFLLLASLLANFILASNPLLSKASHTFYLSTLTLQILFYLAALLGRLPFAPKSRFLSLPAGFLFLNLLTLRGLLAYLSQTNQPGWQPTPPPST